MLVKCNYLDKLHLCTSQERWPNNSTVPWADRLGEAIFTCIPEDIKLRDLFLKWCVLSPEDRRSIDENIITRERFDLYVPLKRAMMHWGRIQDTQGAPGFESGLYAFTCDTNLEEELSNLIGRVEHIIDRIHIRNTQKSEKTLDLLDEQPIVALGLDHNS